MHGQNGLIDLQKTDVQGGQILVVGSDGLIGSALLKAFGPRAIGTSRKEKSGKIKLDLANEKDCWQNLPNFTHAFVCAGETSLKICDENPQDTHLINVTNTLKLIKNLLLKRTKIIYFSTSLVFNGLQKYPNEGEKVDPICKYGYQKAIVEKELFQYGQNTLVIRLTKVVTPSLKLLSNWFNCLNSGGKIDAFVDYHFAPIDLGSIVNLATKVVFNWKSNILQISSNRDISYYDAAKIFVDVCGFSEER